MYFINNVKSQIIRGKKELKLPEYIFWWVIRLVMIYSVFSVKNVRGYSPRFLLVWNFIACFTISILSFIFSEKTFLGRIPFRIQSYIICLVTLGSFFGQYLQFNRFEGNYDKIVHIFTGFFGVLIGYEIAKIVCSSEVNNDNIILFGSLGFSYVIMVIWEIFEFWGDFFMNGNNQGYTKAFCDKVYTDNYFFIRIFGRGVAGDEHLAMFDTDIDLMCAVIGSVIAVVLLRIIISRSKTKHEAAKDSVTV